MKQSTYVFIFYVRGIALYKVKECFARIECYNGDNDGYSDTTEISTDPLHNMIIAENIIM